MTAPMRGELIYRIFLQMCYNSIPLQPSQFACRRTTLARLRVRGAAPSRRGRRRSPQLGRHHQLFHRKHYNNFARSNWCHHNHHHHHYTQASGIVEPRRGPDVQTPSPVPARRTERFCHPICRPAPTVRTVLADTGQKAEDQLESFAEVTLQEEVLVAVMFNEEVESTVREEEFKTKNRMV
jgi:hypothetical protein